MLKTTPEPRFDIPELLEPNLIPKAKVFGAGVAVGVILGTHQLGAWFSFCVFCGAGVIVGAAAVDEVIRRFPKRGG